MKHPLEITHSEKYEALKRFIKEKGKDGVIIAFSGGLDSSTLASVAYEHLGTKAIAVTAESPAYPESELEDAKRVAKEIGIEHHLITSNELADEAFVRNPEKRCYYCKKGLLVALQTACKEFGFSAIFEGTNASELGGHRPGFKAITETVNAYSPWVEAGFTRDEIRTLAKNRGLSIYDKPSFACLSSRIPFESTITSERLDRIAKAEAFIKKVTNALQLRVRDHEGIARIELGPGERPLFFNTISLDPIYEKLKEIGFTFVTMDLAGYRTGSMLATAEPTGKNSPSG